MVKINAIRNTVARIACVTCLILVRSLTHLAAQPIGIASLARQHDGALAQMPEQVDGNRAIAGLARRQRQFPGQAARQSGRGSRSSRQPAARAAHTAIRVTFFELAAC